MSAQNVSRVRFFERQFLRTRDLSDEQAYHLAMRRRHNISHHIWGIVSGLKIGVDAESGAFQLAPGMAIDGYGRELIVSNKRPLPVNVFVNLDSEVIDVWLLYAQQETDPSPFGEAPCQYGVGNYRSVEFPRIDLRRPDPSSSNRRQPPGVPPADWDFDPSRTPPDDPLLSWPVFLGQMVRQPLDPDATQFDFSVNLSNRPLAGLRGERIVAPSTRARMQLGAERQEDFDGFAVYVTSDEPPDVKPSHGDGSGAAIDEPRLSISRDQRIEVRGETTIHGTVSVAGAGVEFREQDPGNQASAAPWRIYRTFAGPTTDDRSNPAEARFRELRLVIPIGEEEEQSRVIVGFWSDQNEFVPCLTIEEKPPEALRDTDSEPVNVTVHGNLTVEGKLTPEQGVGGSAVTLEVQQLLASVFQTGLTGSGLAGQVQTLTTLLSTDVGREIAAPILVGQIAGREELAEAFESGESNEFGHLMELILGLNDEGQNGPEIVKQGVIRIMELEAAETDGRQAIAGAIDVIAGNATHLELFAQVVGGEDGAAASEFLDGFVNVVTFTENGRSATADELAGNTDGQAALGGSFQRLYVKTTAPNTNPLADVLAQLIVLPDAATPPPHSGVKVVQDAVLQIVQLAAANAADQGRIAIAGGIKQIADDTGAGGALNVFGPFVGQEDDYAEAFLTIVHSHEDGQIKSAEALVALSDGIDKFAAKLPNAAIQVEPLAEKLLSSNNRCDAIVKELGNFSSSTTNQILERFARRLAELDLDPDPDPATTKFRLVDLAKQIFENPDRMATVADSLPQAKGKLQTFIEGLTRNATRAQNVVSNLIEFVDPDTSDPVEAQKGMLAIYGSLDDGPTRVTKFGQFIQARDTQTGETLANELIVALGGTPP